MKLAPAVLVTMCGLAMADREPEPLPSRQRPPPPPPPAVKSAEVQKLGKDLAGSYKCQGVALQANGSSSPLQATLTIELALDSTWIQASLVETGKATPLRFVDYRTYDPVGKQWTRIQLTSMASHVVSTSLGEKNGTWTWEGTATAPTGTLQLRDYEQLAHGKLKVWGEALQSGSWQKQYEVTCSL